MQWAGGKGRDILWEARAFELDTARVTRASSGGFTLFGGVRPYHDSFHWI